MITDIDFHSHILPCCDHGSDSVKTSLTQVSYAQNAGVKTICATPHFYSDTHDLQSFLELRTKCYENLKKELPDTAPKIRLGAEVLVFDDIDRLKGLELLRLEGTRYLLLEMPFYKWHTSLVETVFRVADMDNITVIIAHADRYPVNDIQTFINEGLRLQLNISAFDDLFKRHTYLKWIKKGYVKFIGSDIHGTSNAYKNWSKYFS